MEVSDAGHNDANLTHLARTLPLLLSLCIAVMVAYAGHCSILGI